MPLEEGHADTSFQPVSLRLAKSAEFASSSGLNDTEGLNHSLEELAVRSSALDFVITNWFRQVFGIRPYECQKSFELVRPRKLAV